MTVDLAKHEHVKFQLRLAGSSMAAIARELSVSHSSVTVVSQGYRTSSRILEAIAAKLNQDPASIWPERFSDNYKTREDQS
jgi:Ner family transcriptional regulator